MSLVSNALSGSSYCCNQLTISRTAIRSSTSRRSVVRAAAAGGPPPPTQRSAASGRTGRQLNLVRLLAQQTVKEVWGGWLGDLVLPLVTDDTGAAAPPPPTVPPRQLADPDSLFVAVDGIEVHYKEAWPGGARDGTSDAASAARRRPAVLLVHGLNGSTFNWRATMQPLADATGSRVVAFDRPPYGLTQRPLEWGQPGQALQYNPYTTDGSARITQGLLDALGINQVVAVGHSAGAVVCMELALREPGRVAALGFVAPALPTTPDKSWQRRATLGGQLRLLAARAMLSDDQLGLRYVRRQLLKRRDEVLAGEMRLHSEDYETPQDVIDGYLRPLRAQDWDRASLLNFRAFSFPTAYDYGQLHQPVLLVQGTEDGVLTTGARELAKLLQGRRDGGTRFVELQGIGHVPMDECPQHLNQLLIEFVHQSVGGQQADGAVPPPPPPPPPHAPASLPTAAGQAARA